MALRLRVVSDHAKRLGENGSKLFGVHGGTIGRSIHNEWILPDPERYLSGKHARIDFRAGTYLLTDTSSNGTFINGAAAALGKDQAHPLKDGDIVALGEYELMVSIDASNDFPPDEGAIVAYDGRAPSPAAKKSTADDLGEDLDLSELLEVEDAAPAVAPRERPAAPAAQPSADAQEALPWHLMTRPFKAAAATLHSADESGTPLYEGEPDPGLAALCRGAGIDPRRLPPAARAGALQLAGQLLREAVLGLLELNQSQSEFRARFGLPAPPPDAPETALDFSRGVEEALVRLLSTLSTRAGAVPSVRQNYRDLKAQGAAQLAATRAAFEAFLGRLDPAQLEERFARSAQRGVFAVHSKARYWELYTELFAGLAQRPAEGFPHVYGEAFAEAYEKACEPRRAPARATVATARSAAPEPALGEP